MHSKNSSHCTSLSAQNTRFQIASLIFAKEYKVTYSGVPLTSEAAEINDFGIVELYNHSKFL